MAIDFYIILSVFIYLFFSTIFKKNKIPGYLLASVCAMIPMGQIALHWSFVVVVVILWMGISCINIRRLRNDERIVFDHLAVLIVSVIAISSVSFFTLLMAFGFMLLIRLRTDRGYESIDFLARPLSVDITVFFIFGFILLLLYSVNSSAMTFSILVLLTLIGSQVLSFPLRRFSTFNHFVSCFLQPLILLKFIFLFKAVASLEIKPVMLYLVIGTVLAVLIKDCLRAPKILSFERVFQVNNLIIFLAAIIFGSMKIEELIFAIIFNSLVYIFIVLKILPHSFKQVISLLLPILPLGVLIRVTDGQILSFQYEFGIEVLVLFVTLGFLPLLLHINLVRGFSEEV